MNSLRANLFTRFTSNTQHFPQKTLCKYPGNSVRTIQRWRKNVTADKRKGSERKITRKLTPEERQKIYPARDLNSQEQCSPGPELVYNFI